MAGMTIKPAVTAVQLEMGALVMVETPRLPIARVVTLTTVRSEAQLVFVVFLMARDALTFCILIRLR